VVAIHQIRIKLKPECRCRTPVGGKACRDRRNSAKTGGGSRGPQICGGHAIRLGGLRSDLLVGRRPARQLIGAISRARSIQICRSLCGTMKLTS
jgi:hypothetical protein